MSIIVQVLCTGFVCCLNMSMGLMFAWPSSTLQLFISDNTTLNRPLTQGEMALFGLLPLVGAVISTPIVGLLLDRLGRKYNIFILSLLGVLSWVMIIASNRVEVLLSAMFVLGLSNAVFLVVPVFVSEFCQESIRGAMTSGSMTFYGVGMLLSYLLGGLLSYHTMVCACLSISVVATVLLVILKESPVCLMAKGMEEEAAKSIAFYRNTNVDANEVLQEMNVLRKLLHPELETLEASSEVEQMQALDQSKKKLPIFLLIKKSISTRQALYVCVVLITVGMLQAPVLVQIYVEPQFEEAILSMAFTFCIMLLVGLAAACFIELAGRRPLMICSAFVSGLSCVILGTQTQLHWSPDWLIVVVIYTFTAAFMLGTGTVPFVITAEVFLPEVKSFVTMLVVEWAWLCDSIILFIFNPMLHAIGLGSVFYIFAVICFLTAAFCLVYLPETKGLTVDAIQDAFVKKRNEKKN